MPLKKFQIPNSPAKAGSRERVKSQINPKFQIKNKAKKVVFLVGPTGVGKTAVSIKLAKKINGEIVCCDSMQVYKDMRILTGRPAKKQMSQLPHHLFGVISATENFSVAQYRKLALKEIKEIHKKDKLPIFVGGTGLYVEALLDGLFYSPAEDIKLRKKFQVYAKKYGSHKLHEKLKKIDPIAARIIHPNDLRRIIRALEVYKVMGKTISELKLDSSGGIFGLYPTYIFCLFYKHRNLLYSRINERVEGMFRKGVVNEVKSLLKAGLSKTASQALGIKEIQGFIDGIFSLEHTKELLKRNTRRYAKRQLSWFRRDKRTNWVALDNQKVLDIIEILADNINNK